MLNQHGAQCAVEFTQNAPWLLGAPLIHLVLLFPEFKQQLHLLSQAHEHQGFRNAQPLDRHSGNHDGPLRQHPLLLRHGLTLILSLFFSHLSQGLLDLRYTALGSLLVLMIADKRFSHDLSVSALYSCPATGTMATFHIHLIDLLYTCSI